MTVVQRAFDTRINISDVRLSVHLVRTDRWAGNIYEVRWMGRHGVAHVLRNDYDAHRVVQLTSAFWRIRGDDPVARADMPPPTLGGDYFYMDEPYSFDELSHLMGRNRANSIFTVLGNHIGQRANHGQECIRTGYHLRGDYRVNPGVVLEGRRIYHAYPHGFAATTRTAQFGYNSRAALKEFGKAVATVLGSPDADLDAIVEKINEFNNPFQRAALYNALPVFLRQHLVMCSCGHAEVDGNQSGDQYGNSACNACMEDGEWVQTVDTDRIMRRHDAHEGVDGDFYQYSDDDDDDDENPEGMYDWSTPSTNVLNSPEIASSATGDFTIGMEFECEPRGRSDRHTLVRHVCRNHAGTIMCKADGSLSSTGVELVLAPMTLESTKKAWTAVTFPSGTKAWNAGSCGTHVHIDARAFTKLSLAKFVAFWNNPENEDLITKVAGRHPRTSSQAADYAALISMDTTSIMRTMKAPNVNNNRYRCVNLTTLGLDQCERLGLVYPGGHHSNYNTVELRIFRASLRPERTLAQIEMAHASVVFARDGSCSDMSAKAFTLWLAKSGRRYPHLKSWLGIQRPHIIRATQTETERA